MNYKSLLLSRFFAPMFWTQFLGAFNDNLYKNALIILITYPLLDNAEFSAGFLIPLSAALFILPFFLFSALAGQLADKYEKSHLIRMIKSLEVFIMLLTLIGIYFNNVFFLIAVLFFMGCQSSLFGPVKYSILPQHLNENGLLKANALFGMGTFLAILLGTIAGGILASVDNKYYISAAVIFIALTGRFASQFIPEACSVSKDLVINWNIFSEWRYIFKQIINHKLLLGAVLSISWFWFLGATILTILPVYTKNVLQGEALVLSLLLAIFTSGIGMGALIVGQTGILKKSLKWIVIGTLGISLCSAHLYWNSAYIDTLTPSLVHNWQFMFSNTWTLIILLDMFALGVSAGFYIVPLYVVIQEFSDIKIRSRIIAGNNISNAFFMVCSAIMIMLMNNYMPIESYFLLLSIANVSIVSFFYVIFSSEIRKIR